ncbi:hypothetical protein POTOM_005459 [Populus tomentosa]|uniref:Sphingomyelin synthase-like domain-containing protein n=1 Tax=Populus tomentosa TaxID=118781 RepID=A0A8X8AMJ3_POPTO|nr:hypothetical protein POTOM_005459 [Populus tomentosa]
MPFYIARQAPKLWRKICTETTIEISLVAENRRLLLAGIVFQYIHGLAAHGIHYLHRPGPTLQDAGFFLLPELGQDRAYVSETSFTFIFASFVLFPLAQMYASLLFNAGRRVSFVAVDHPSLRFPEQENLYSSDMVQGPCLFSGKCFFWVCCLYEVLLLPEMRPELEFVGNKYLLARFFVYSHSIRLIFLVQITIAMRYNFLFQGSKLARLPHPKSAIELLVINFSRGVNYGCGDLIFSSHMIFTIVFVRTFHKYGTNRCIKQLAWLLAVVQSFLIVASHKHYTVDVVVAWYTVNLVTFFIDKKLPDLPERPTGLTSLPLLPQSRDWDSKNKEKHQILLTGVTVETAG